MLKTIDCKGVNNFLDYLNAKEKAANGLLSLQVCNNENNVKGFVQRHITSRITAVAFCALSLLLLAPKLLGGVWQVGRDSICCITHHTWNHGLLDPTLRKKYLYTLLFSCTSPIRLLVAIVSPARLISLQPLSQTNPTHNKPSLRPDASINHQEIATAHLQEMTPREIARRFSKVLVSNNSL